MRLSTEITATCFVLLLALAVDVTVDSWHGGPYLVSVKIWP
jgi:hypothetical protein